MLMIILSLFVAYSACSGHDHDSLTLFARQEAATSTAFTASFYTTVFGGCAANGFSRCGNVCVDLPAGDSCCDSSSNYWCQSGSYCLFDGLCCSDDMDPQDCANNSNLKLPKDFSRPAKAKSNTKTSSSSSSDDSESSSYPTIDEDSAAPKEAAPITTTFGPFVATVSNKPVTVAYSGEVLPLQTTTNHKPVPKSFRDDLLAVLAKDPETKAFGDLLNTMPSVFDSLDADKQYWLFAPTTKFVIDFLQGTQEDGDKKLGRRKVLVSPQSSLQFAQKPQDSPDIKHVERTLKTALVGETKYVDLGNDEGARVVSKPASGENGDVEIISGFGNSTLIHSAEIPFERGIIKKCDGFFTLPRAMETVFGDTSGRLWSTALQEAKLLTQLSEKRMVTIFAVQDSAMDKKKLPASADLSRLIYDGLSYTPDMSDGLCLPTRGDGTVHITRKDKDILVNGVAITKSDVIAKNGVIHYLEKIPPVEKCTVSAGVKGDEKSDGSTVVVSMIAAFGLSVASFAVYAWV